MSRYGSVTAAEKCEVIVIKELKQAFGIINEDVGAVFAFKKNSISSNTHQPR